MQLLVLNPNISESVTRLIDAEARASAPADAVVKTMTAPFGVAYIETRFEAMIGAYAVACMAGEAAEDMDAVIVAAFGDPGAAALKEVLPIPVVGMTEAALATACLLGHRFTIIAISQRIRVWYREVVESYGLIERLASIRALDAPLVDIGRVRENQSMALRRLCDQAIREDGAEVIILAGAPLAGLARSMDAPLGVPIVDGVSSAVRHAVGLTDAALGHAFVGGYAPPPRKFHRGLSKPIARLLSQGSLDQSL